MTETGATVYDSAPSGAGVGRWLVLLYTVAVVVLYRETAWSIFSIWQRSDTYAHGFLIVPIALWLVWEKRAVLAAMTVRPDLRVLALMIPAGFLWLLANMVNVQVVQQLAFVTILVVGIWALVGNTIAATLAFPLGFLFLGVPMGEDLLPVMKEFTATSTVWLVQLTGIPIYREGLHFSLPSGNWSVVDACSGSRYLIASFTLGTLYAYLSYRSLSRRLTFVLVSVVVPVIANSLRAYVIVMLGHLSGMTLATGVDHLIYGWVFFGLVMLLLFWVGSFWHEDAVSDEDQVIASRSKHPTEPGRPLLAVTLVLLTTALWPLLTVAIAKSRTLPADTELLAPLPGGTWETLEIVQWGWEPTYRGADRTMTQFYRRSDEIVALYIRQSFHQEQGGELVDSRRHFRLDPKRWRVSSQTLAAVEMGGEREQVIRAELAGLERNLLVWSWYRIGEGHTADAYEAKLREVAGKLTFGRVDAARIVLAIDAAAGEDAEKVLQSFLTTHLAAIEASIDRLVQDVEP